MLKARFGENAEITPGKSGQFDVIVDGRLIFSKAQTGRFPVDDEIEAMYSALKDGKELPAAKSEEKKPEGFLERILGKMRN